MGRHQHGVAALACGSKAGTHGAEHLSFFTEDRNIHHTDTYLNIRPSKIMDDVLDDPVALEPRLRAVALGPRLRAAVWLGTSQRRHGA